jgi:hypothetical protein
MDERALWNDVTSRTTTSRKHQCTPFTLPANGVLTLDASTTITLTTEVVFRPECTSLGLEQASATTPYLTLTDFRDPFFASTLPACYALAACTVIAYMLVIMLLITPRTFVSGGMVRLGRRGFTNSRSGAIGVGGRPILQKVAALTVAISLTIATADTIRVAEDQYDLGLMDAQELQRQVFDSTELKVIRIISDTFLWLAQAQTLIRLFPRQREKIIIKWTAFSLIVLDLIFRILNTFVYTTGTRPGSFTEAVPALSYLFQLALGLLYCAWVLYYAIMKKRYAFYHSHMRNICLVALLSVIALVVPVVFFILDVAQPSVAVWGDYVRWVGAAAASVVVWEWVERIEALERNDKKDGVLGREVFDGDEMLEVTPTADVTRFRRSRRPRGDDENGELSTGSSSGAWHSMTGIAQRYRPRLSPHSEANENQSTTPRKQGLPPSPSIMPWPTRPPPAATPISRGDTASADSTVYAVRYHPIGSSRQSNRSRQPQPTSRNNSLDIEAQVDIDTDDSIESEKPRNFEHKGGETPKVEGYKAGMWEALSKVNIFNRAVQAPPAEVSAHTSKPPQQFSINTSTSRWDFISRFEDFASIQAERLREKAKPSQDLSALPVTRIPAPPRTRTQQDLDDLLCAAVQEEEPQLSSAPQDTVAGASAIEASPSPNFAVTQSMPPSRDIYVPGDAEGRAVVHRGSLSFAAIRRDPRSPEIQEITSANNSSRPGTGTLPQSPRQSSFRSISSGTGHLPVTRIPAPPRQPRPSED